MKRLILATWWLLCLAVAGKAQTLYGLTYHSSNGNGMIQKLETATNILTQPARFHHFQQYPVGQLLETANGKLYGMTSNGNGQGNIYYFDRNTLKSTSVHFFDGTNGAHPYGSLMKASDGKLYGMTAYGGVNGDGVIFSLDPATNTFAKLVDFSSTNGRYPYGSLIQANDGKLYGLTAYGGANDAGVLFSFDPSTNTYAKLRDFISTTGSQPFGSLLKAASGILYGMTHSGGVYGNGVIFSFETSTATYTKVKDFDYPNGANPYVGNQLIQGQDGKLYGNTHRGGTAGYGVIFSFDLSGNVYTKLKDFSSGDGIYIYGGIIQASNGKLYGQTYQGGSGSYGTVFQLNTDGSGFSVIKHFVNYQDGAYSYSNTLMQAADGKLYGTTRQGGFNGWGTLFTVDPATSTFQKLSDNGNTGLYPLGDLVQGNNNKLYGTTHQGGALGGGTIYSYDPLSNEIETIFNRSASDGQHQFGSLFKDDDGKFYGMTLNGGTSDAGVIFSFNPSSNSYVKHFDFNQTNGAHPYGSLMKASDGKLYGMTVNGGVNGYGVIFSFDPATGTYTKLLDFANTTARHPHGSLTQANNGKLYGMTAYGGTSDRGVLFSYDPSTNAFVSLRDFDNTNGAHPFGSLLKAADGKLYGMTHSGGTNGYGVIFSYDPSTAAYAKLKDFDYTNGGQPYIGNNLLEVGNGKMYGLTFYGGSAGNGTAFSFEPSSGTFTKIADFTGTNGYNPYGSFRQGVTCPSPVTYYKDQDGDGLGDPGQSIVSCDPVSGYVTNNTDNCPAVANADQLDTDGDGQGNACDTDDDGDGVLDVNDNCPLTANANQLNTDGDSEGNVCDTDDDNDGILDADDCAPLVAAQLIAGATVAYTPGAVAAVSLTSPANYTFTSGGDRPVKTGGRTWMYTNFAVHPNALYWTLNPVMNPRHATQAGSATSMAFTSYNASTGIATWTSTQPMVYTNALGQQESITTRVRLQFQPYTGTHSSTPLNSGWLVPTTAGAVGISGLSANWPVLSIRNIAGADQYQVWYIVEEVSTGWPLDVYYSTYPHTYVNASNPGYSTSFGGTFYAPGEGVCEGKGSVTVTATGGTAPYTGTGTFQLAAGTHNLTVTDANGCSSIATVNVAPPPAVQAGSTVSFNTAGALGSVPFASITTGFTQAGGLPSLGAGRTWAFNNISSPYSQLYWTLSVGNAWHSSQGGPTGSMAFTGYDASTGILTWTSTANITYQGVNGPVSRQTRLRMQLQPHSGTNQGILGSGWINPVTIPGTGGVMGVDITALAQPRFQAWYRVEDVATGMALNDYYNNVANSANGGQTNTSIGGAWYGSQASYCEGGSQAAVIVTGTGGTAPYTGTGTFYVGAGAYSFTVTDANGCTSTTTGTVSFPTRYTYYRDGDGDGYGNAAVTTQVCAAEPPAGYVTDNTDCNDGNQAVNPSLVWYLDADGDGFALSTTQSCTSPGAGYTLTVLPVTDCDDTKTLYQDSDGDGFGRNVKVACGGVENNTDCEDTDDTINPNTIWYLDADNDGYHDGTATGCTSPGPNYKRSAANGGGDCNDGASAINPGATEVCNGIDDDCDGTIDDGFINTVVTCPVSGTATRNLEAGCDYTVVGTEFDATVEQNCGPLGYTLTGATQGTGSTLAGVHFNVGTTTVTWSATKSGGQAVTCSFTVTVVPPPLNLTCPGNVEVAAEQGKCEAVVNYTAPSAPPACSSGGGTYTMATVAYNPFNMSGATFIGSCDDCQFGPVQLPFSFSYFGNVFSQVYVYPSTNAFISFQPTSSGCCSGQPLPNASYPNTIFAAWSDWVPSIHYKVFGTAPNRIAVFAFDGPSYGGGGSINSQIALYEGTNQVQIIHTNVSNTTYFRTQGLNKDGNVAFIVPGRNATLGWTAFNESRMFTPGASVTQTAGLPSGSAFPVGTTTNTFVVTDAFGQQSTCSFTVKVNDDQAPQITDPSDITVSNIPDACNQQVSFGAVATDNCAVTSKKFFLNYGTQTQTEITSPQTFNVGTYVVTVEAKDAAGNTSTETFTIKVEDNQIPYVTAGTINSCYATQAAAEAAARAATGRSDNCTATQNLQVDVTTAGTCNAVITVKVTDAAGKFNSVSYNTRIDNTKPVLSVYPTDVTVSCHEVPAVPEVTATDNCEPGTLAVTYTELSNTKGADPTQASFYNYQIKRKWEVMDGCGNTETHIQTIQVQDITDPVITCPDNHTSVPYDFGQLYATINIGTATATDNCATGHVTITNNNPHTNFQYPLGPTTITWTATDPTGNDVSCNQSITVRKRNTLVTYTGDVNSSGQVCVQYSDIITLKAKLTDNEGLNPANNISGRTITFELLNSSGTVMRTKTTTTNTSGEVVDTLKVQQAPGTYSIRTTFAGDAYFNSSQDNEATIVKQEDALVDYNSSQYFTTPSASNLSGLVTLMTSVNDIDDGSDKRGDIRKAKITFRDGGSAGQVLGTPNNVVGLVNPGDLTKGLSSTTHPYTLNNNEASGGGKVFQVWVGASDHYTGTDAGPTPVTLALPGQDYVTGGGNYIMSNSAGTYAGTANAKMNFGFTMKWNRSGRNLQGQINIVYRRWENFQGTWQWRVYQIKSNAINSMAVQTAGGYSKASINTKATLTDVTTEGATISYGGGHDLILDAWDHTTANGGSMDMIGVRLVGNNTSELLFASSWSNNTHQVQLITGGNINVRSNSSTTPAATTRVAMPAPEKVVEAEATLEAEAYPNPASSYFTVRVKASNLSQPVQLRVTDVTGRTIQVMEKVQPGQTVRMGENLKIGAYFIEARQGNLRTTLKVVKL